MPTNPGADKPNTPEIQPQGPGLAAELAKSQEKRIKLKSNMRLEQLKPQLGSGLKEFMERTSLEGVKFPDFAVNAVEGDVLRAYQPLIELKFQKHYQEAIEQKKDGEYVKFLEQFKTAGESNHQILKLLSDVFAGSMYHLAMAEVSKQADGFIAFAKAQKVEIAKEKVMFRPLVADGNEMRFELVPAQEHAELFKKYKEEAAKDPEAEKKSLEEAKAEIANHPAYFIISMMEQKKGEDDNAFLERMAKGQVDFTTRILMGILGMGDASFYKKAREGIVKVFPAAAGIFLAMEKWTGKLVGKEEKKEIEEEKHVAKFEMVGKGYFVDLLREDVLNPKVNLQENVTLSESILGAGTKDAKKVTIEMPQELPEGVTLMGPNVQYRDVANEDASKMGAERELKGKAGATYELYGLSAGLVIPSGAKVIVKS